MTETNPLGHHRARQAAPRHRRTRRRACRAARRRAIAVPFVETRHVGRPGRVLPWDGETMGELEVRGPWVAASYMGDEGKDRWTEDGWFKTGDVVTIDAEGYVRIADRSKDVIKSGGEWISSVALENALMSHPAVLEAAVFAGRHAKWAERPIAAIVFKKDRQATEAELARTSRASSRSSGCPTPTCSWSRSRAPRPASSSRPGCARPTARCSRGAQPRRAKTRNRRMPFGRSRPSWTHFPL